MSSVAGDLLDAGQNVPQAHADGAPPRIHRVYGIQNSLDLRL
jgi:hypothetical protein